MQHHGDGELEDRTFMEAEQTLDVFLKKIFLNEYIVGHAQLDN